MSDFFLSAPRKISAGSARSQARYGVKDGRHLLVGTVGIRSTADMDDLMRSHRHGRPFAAFLLSDLSDAPGSAYAFAKATSRALHATKTASTALFIVHGPPAEPTNLHAHVVAYTGGASEAQVRRDLLATFNEHGLLARSPFSGPPRNRKTERDDDYGFGEWLDRCGFYDAILAAPTPQHVADALAAFDVAREPYALGFILRDRSAASGVAVKASSFDLSDASLQARFGTAEVPRSRTAAARSYTDERDTKYPIELHEAHTEARATWENEIADLVAADRSKVFAESLSRRNRRDSLARGLLTVAGLPKDAANLDAARRLVYRDTDRYVERGLRAIEEHYPAKPARRVGDWLRQIHDFRPTAVATAPGARLSPHRGQRIADDVDRDLYDEDGIIVAHEDATGVELRTLEANVALEHAQEIVFNYRLGGEDIPPYFSDVQHRFTDAPPGPPQLVQTILDSALAHQLDRAFAPEPRHELGIDSWTDDDREYQQISVGRRSRRRRATYWRKSR